jgi:uncharacterized protein (DUF2252 family)
VSTALRAHLAEVELSISAAGGASVKERLKAGRSLRRKVPHSSHGRWKGPADRQDPISILRASDRLRLPDLLPIRYGRMLDSPFTFLRGAAAVMARDLARTPTTMLPVQACGDAHCGNFRIYGTPERNREFGLNDFDETLPAPWEWDLKRLAASLVVVGRVGSLSDASCQDSARAAVRSYRLRMREYARTAFLDVWYSHLKEELVLRAVPKAHRKVTARHFERAAQRDNIRALEKLTRNVRGKVKIVDDPPLIVHVHDDPMARSLQQFIATYVRSLHDSRRTLLSRYRLEDFARKVVGVGSVGTRCYVLLFQGKSWLDPLFLQIKQAFPSVLEPFAGRSSYRNHGQRVAVGKRLIQATSDIFLGFGQVAGLHFYVRQLWDMKRKLAFEGLSASQLQTYADLCGWALARAHARSGDAARIAGYLGRSESFDDAITRFARAYADQTEADHEALVAAWKAGRVPAERGR